jgi:hypothetical protein
MSTPVLSSLSIVLNAYNCIGEIKDAPQQIQVVSQSLEISFRILGNLKRRLEDAEGVDESADDMSVLGNVEEKLFETCQQLAHLVAPYKNAAGTARKGWLVSLRWTLKKRQLHSLERDLERWGKHLVTALRIAQWYV